MVRTDERSDTRDSERTRRAVLRGSGVALVAALGWSSTGSADDGAWATFEIVATDAGAELNYRFVVEGDVERARTDEDVSSIDEANDAILRTDDGTVTVVGETGDEKGDAYRVDGEVVSFSVLGGTSEYVLTLDGNDVTNDLPSDAGRMDDPNAVIGGRTFEIVSTERGADVSYRFTVDGPVARTSVDDSITSLDENNDAVERNSDGTTTVIGETGDRKGDAYQVDGRIVSFERLGGTSDYVLTLDGEDVTDGLSEA